MKSLTNLPDIANRQLGGLEATSVLLAKTKLRAAEAQARQKPQMRRRLSWQPALAICTALVLCLGATLWVTNGTAPITSPVPTQNVLSSRSAGSTEPTAKPNLSGDVPVGSISMSVGGQSGGQTLFADAQGSSFPLISIDGATYRLLRSPSGISASLLGDELGKVSEFNLEPALGSGGIVSNLVSQGESVYAISGLGGALVAANSEGLLRVFQRVSYAGTAVIGNETLGDTLCSASDVAWLELAGVGKISNVEDAQHLMQLLLDGSDYMSTGASGTDSLQIGLSNGLTLQLFVGDDAISACGTWSCPDFFEAYHEAVGK
ncbi:MAG: hypothetical protein RR142_10545 [Clostridia bacterium]